MSKAKEWWAVETEFGAIIVFPTEAVAHKEVKIAKDARTPYKRLFKVVDAAELEALKANKQSSRRKDRMNNASGRPITPDEAKEGHAQGIPPEVFDIFNDLLRKYASARKTIIIKQDEVVNLIVKKMNVQRNEVFDKGWLEIEASYINYGWDVQYEKPAYNEEGYAYFEFTPAKTGRKLASSKADRDD